MLSSPRNQMDAIQPMNFHFVKKLPEVAFNGYVTANHLKINFHNQIKTKIRFLKQLKQIINN